MRPHRFTPVLLVALIACGATPALAQQGQRAPARPPAPVVRYVTFSEGMLSSDTSATVEGVLKTTTVGKEVRSAEIDICFQTDKLSLRLDRVAIPLQVQPGNLLTGTGPALDGTSTSIRIRRTAEDDGTVQIEGEVNRQNLRLTVSGSGLEPSEEDPLEIAQDDAPAASLLTVPNEMEVTVALPALPDILKLARTLRIAVRETNLLADCRAIRTGKVTLTAVAPPDRLAGAMAEVAKLRGVQKVAPAASFDYDYAIRFRPATAPAATDVAALMTRNAGRAIPGLSTVSTRVDPVTGVISAVMRRAPDHLAALGLEERVTLKALLAADKEAGRFVIHLRELEGRLADPATPPVLMSPTSPSEGMEAASAGGDLNTTAALAAIADAITREVGGERVVGEAWVAPTRR